MWLNGYDDGHGSWGPGKNCDCDKCATQRSLDFLRSFPDTCTATVTRKGEGQPCEKPAVAATAISYGESVPAWPVCAWHANRIGHLVPLRDLLAVPAAGVGGLSAEGGQTR